MKTTIRLRDNNLLKRAKKRGDRSQVPVSRASGGVLPGVDLNRSTDLGRVDGRRMTRDSARFQGLKGRPPN